MDCYPLPPLGDLFLILPHDWLALVQVPQVPQNAGVTGPSASTSGGSVPLPEEGNGVWATLGKLGVTPQDVFQMMQSLILVAIILFAGWVIAGVVSRMVSGALAKARFDTTLTLFFAKMARWGVLLITGISILGLFGVETTSLAAVIGAASLAIGLAFQGTLSNFASGVMLLIFRPYKVGDIVNVNGTMGKVHELELFTTTLDTPDNRRFIVPNSSIFGATIENVTHHQRRRVDVKVSISYDADIDHTKVVLSEAVAQVEGVLTDPHPVVYLDQLGTSSVDWYVRAWCETKDYWPIREKVTRAVKMSLDQAGIRIPYPQLDLHLDQPLVNSL